MFSRSLLLLPTLVATIGKAQTVVMPTVEMPRVEMPGTSTRIEAPQSLGQLFGPAGDLTGTWSTDAFNGRILITGSEGGPSRELIPSPADQAIWVPAQGGIERWHLDPVIGALRMLP
ncbi:MAG: hypothetical protein WEC15_06645 [Flavobacteriales bacterium]